MRRPSVSVFVAVSSGTLRVSMEHQIPIALISAAMDVDVAIAALNHVGYGSGRATSEGSKPFVAERGWNDWVRLRLEPPSRAPTWGRTAWIDGAIDVPVGDVDITTFVDLLSGLLKPRGLGADVGTPKSGRVEPRYLLASRGEGVSVAEPIDDLYRFDPNSDVEFLCGSVDTALRLARTSTSPAC